MSGFSHRFVYLNTQAAIKPPTFVMFVNDPKLFPDDYKLYMERSLRENIGFPGSPLRILWRGKVKGDREQPPRGRLPAKRGSGQEDDED